MFRQTLKMSFTSIITNKMRSFLTMLGIIIGVMALVVLVSIVDGATGTITDSVNSLGSQALLVYVQDDKGEPITNKDLKEWAGTGAVEHISPYTQATSTVKYSKETGSATTYGVNEYYDSIATLKMASGRFFKQPDLDNHTNVVIVNRDFVKDLMKLSDPDYALGQTVMVNGYSFEVIGVLEDKTAGSSSSDSMMMYGMNKYTIYVPYTTLLRVSPMATRNIKMFSVDAYNDDLTAAEDTINQLMMKRLDNDDKAFTVLNFQNVMDVMNTIRGTLSVVMAGVAAISLIVGGIGIMNIMLVSVTERTREIGIRKAIGASRRSIMLQFLLESLMISLIGCALGVFISFIILQLATHLADGMATFPMQPGIVTAAVIFSVAVGLIFGLYPANKAAKMKPIDALRHTE